MRFAYFEVVSFHLGKVLSYLQFLLTKTFPASAYNVHVKYVLSYNCKKETYMRFGEADRMLKDDEWYVSYISGSHYPYKHPTKPGKVSVPNHPGDIPKSIVKSIQNQVGPK